MPRNVSIRIGTDGKAQVVRDFEDIATSGGAAFEWLRAKGEREFAALESAADRLAKTQERLAAVSANPVQATIDRSTGVTGGQGQAAALASAQSLAREMQRAEDEARQLLAAIDPVIAAQIRYGAQVARIDQLKAVGALDEQNYQRLLLNERTILDQANDAQLRHGAGARGSSIAQMELMHVVRGSADSFAAGMPPMMIFTQHLGMLAQAASYGGESMGKLGAFMGSGWGLLVTAAVSVGGTLLTQLIHTGETVDSLLEKKRHDAEQSALNSQADALWRNTLEGLTATINEQNHALAQRLQLQSQVRDADLSTARSNQIELENRRTVLLGQEGPAERRVRILEAQAANPGSADPRVAGPLQEELAGARQRLAAIVEGLRAVNSALLNNADTISRAEIQRNAAMATAEGQINDRFDRELARLRAQLLNHQISADAEAAGERRISEARAAALRTAQQAAEAERRLSDTRQNGRHITEAQAAAIVRGIGGTVTSQTRDHATQARLYADYLAGRGPLAAPPGHSAHESGTAIDIAMSPGMTAGRIREAFRAQGVSLRQLLLETNPRTGSQHFHADFGGAPGAAHAETLERENAARTVNISGLLAEADAYLRSSDAGARATAEREGLTAATRQGTDTDARARQQLEQNIAQAAVTGAQHVAQLRDETAARHSVTAQVEAGTLAATDMKQAMDDEAALRPLLVLQAQAHGNSLAVLTRVLTAYRAALHDAHAEEAHSDALGALARLRADNDNGRAMLGFTGNDAQRQIFAARLAAEREANERHFTGDDKLGFVNQSMDRARLDQAQRATDQFRQMNQEADDRVSLLRTELGLGMMGEQQRQRVLAIEEQRLRLQREFGPEHQAEIEAILAKVRAEQELQAQVERVRAAHQELQQFGGNVIDEIFNVDNVGHWGDAALRVLHSIEQELLTLAVINPLKNMLFGQSNPTLSTIFKALGDIGGAVAGGGGAGLSHEMGHFAAGTSYAPGGLALIGEEGPELMNVPRGASITPAGDTRRLLAANDRGFGALHIDASIYAPGADSAKLEEVAANQRELIRTLPRRIVETFADAKVRSHGRM
jgi:hypothetical protein